MAEPVYGAFGNVLNLDEQEDRIDPSLIYNVYQQEAQTPTNPALLQYTYGTQNNPVFQWVKTIQTGQRTYDPSNKFDEEALKEYEDLYNTGQVPQELGLVTPADIAKQIALDTGGAIAGLAGGQVGAALVDPNLDPLDTGGRVLEGLKSTFGSTPSQYYQSIKDSVFGNNEIVTSLNKNDLTIVPELKDLDAAKEFGNEKLFLKLQKDKTLTNVGTDKTGEVFALKSTEATKLAENNPAIKKTELIQAGDVAAGKTTVAERLNWGTEAGKSNWANAAGTAGVSFVTSLAMGEKPVKAAKRAAGSAVGKAIGTAVAPALGPLGFVAPIVGTILGSVLGGRVICNELVRQGYMTRKQLVLDYKFTRDYLTPQHVAGYHLWSIWMVKQMRKGRFVKFWKHVATHRANEIAYIYGERNNPDYLGKVYKKILESSCWFLGYFTKESDWSILYNEKEIT